jgi:hypothetical protein
MNETIAAPVQPFGPIASSRVFLGELLSSRARLRFPSQLQAATTTPVRHRKNSERQNRDFSLCLTPRGHPTSVVSRKFAEILSIRIVGGAQSMSRAFSPPVFDWPPA